MCGVAYREGCAVLSGIGDYGKENVDTSSWKRTDLEVRQRRASDLERLLRSPPGMAARLGLAGTHAGRGGLLIVRIFTSD